MSIDSVVEIVAVGFSPRPRGRASQLCEGLPTTHPTVQKVSHYPYHEDPTVNANGEALRPVPNVGKVKVTPTLGSWQTTTQGSDASWRAKSLPLNV
jgi:hypothetical protein